MEFSFIVQVSLIGLFAGVVGTVSGGFIAVCFKSLQKNALSAILGFSAGIMLVIIFNELIKEAFEVGGFLLALIGLTAGITILWLLDVVFPHLHFASCEGEEGRFFRAGILLAIGIALHNIPEGLAIGAGYASNNELGAGLAVIMALHNIPEGVAMASPMVIAGLLKRKIVLAAAMAGLPMGVGAFIGSLIGSISPAFLSFSLGFAAGAMLYIVCDELIPDAHLLAGCKKHLATGGIVAGVICGLIIGAF